MKVEKLSQLNEALMKAENPAFYSAVVVVSPDRKSVLLAKRKDDGQWTTPAGGAEWGETPKQTAVRECFEEANILIAEDMLKELHVRHLDNGKVCHCYMVILPIMPPNIGPHNDPDKEVRKWNWHPIDKSLPEPMSPPRRETMIMALMQLAQINMAETALLDALQDESVIQKSKRAPIGTISPNGKFKKVAEGDWRPVSFKQHKISVKFKHNGKEYSHDFDVHAPTADQAWGQVDAQLKQLEQKIGKIQVTQRHVGLKKSYAENELSGTNIDTTHHAMEDLASRDSVWLSRIKEHFSDFDLAEQPRELDLDFPWKLVARQGDDGIYDGYVKNRNTLDGESGDVVFQVKKMTLPAMIEALKAKEYITEPKPVPPPPPPEKTPEQNLLDTLRQNLSGTGNNITVNIYKSEHKDKLSGGLADKKKPSDFKAEALAEGIKVELEHTNDRNLAQEIAMDHLTEDPDYYKKLKIIEKSNFEELEQALEKARPSYPVGTVRTWGGQKYVKHHDGWVAVSGKHHGKLMGKFKEDAKYKDVADSHSEFDKQSALDQAKKLGEEAFSSGKGAAPAQNKAFMDLLASVQGKMKSIDLMDAFSNAWHKANAKAPVPEPKGGEEKPEPKKEEAKKPEEPKPESKKKDEEESLLPPIDKPEGKEGMKTVSADRLSIKYRGRIGVDGKPSAIPYESPEDSTCNMVGFVAFGKAPKKIQEFLNERLQEAETILSDMGFKFKTPIDFVCQNVASGKNTQAQYLNRITAQDNPRINIVGRDSGITKSLMHEIGHAIDYSLHAGKEAGNRGRMGEKLLEERKGQSDELSKMFVDLESIVNSSDFYNQQDDSKHLGYLKDPTEVFARAFEVYAYVRGQNLVKEGKIKKSFLENYRPDVFKTKNQKLADLQAELKDVTSELNKNFSERTKARTRLREEVMKENNLTPDSLRTSDPDWVKNLDTYQKAEEAKFKSDKEWLDLVDKSNSLQDQRRAIAAKMKSINEDEGRWLEIPKEKQAEFSEKIVGIMDKILKTDPVKKAMELIGLIEVLEKSTKTVRDFEGLNQTLKSLL